MESQFKSIYEGPRWTLLYGSFSGVERTAVIELQKLIQYYVPYILVVRSAGEAAPSELAHVALIGTKGDNSLIAELIERGAIAAPDGAEGYSIAVMDSPWNPNMRLLVVAGSDARGTLYGVQEMVARVFCGGGLLDGAKTRERPLHLESITPFSICEKPAIPRRGLWTWGYVINSYKRYFDNMVRLKMNTITIWNDSAPLNIEEIIDYAHSRGIRVILGFHWGWGYKGSISIANEEDRIKIRNNVLETYRTQYANLKHDGIYFQTLTEHTDLEINGRSTAAWACDLVNDISGKLFELYPDLEIHFGLHATSIGERYKDLLNLNPKVIIDWEDCCGQIPYSYYPAQNTIVTADFETMLEYSRNLATFRKDTEFALVPKGWPCIRWGNDFENHGAFILGEKSALYGKERLLMRQNEWDRINCHWHEHFGKAALFYREMLAVNPNITATGLVEDGMFEEHIQSSVALFAETLWNPYLSDNEIMRRALRPCYSRIPV